MKKPLPFQPEEPATVDSGPVSDEVQRALMTLIADTVNDQTIRKTYRLGDLRHGELDLGSWTITVAQVG